MRKTLIAFAAIAAMVGVGYADTTTWFDGKAGDSSATPVGGSWTSPTPDGVTRNATNFTLDDVDAFAFTASNAKEPSSATNLSFTTSIAFSYAYDDLPDVGSDKVGVIAREYDSATHYWVLGKSNSATAWLDSGIVASDLATAVSINVVISNGTDSAVWAIYTIGNGTPNSYATEIVVGDDSDFSVADYSGSGVINSLVGELIKFAFVIPGQKSIPISEAEAWAQSKGYDTDKVEKMLADETVYTGNRTAAESCILGVATNDTINAEINDTDVAADKLKFTVDCTPISGHSVTYQLKKGGSSVGDPQSSAEFNVDFGVGEYTIVASVDGANKEIPVSKTIGVKNVPDSSAVASAATYCAVPYTADEGDIAVADLFKKALLASGDQIDVFNSSDASWKSFTFTDGAWAGVEKSGVTPDPATTTLKRGQAFKFTRASGASATPAYLGYVSTDAATVSMPVRKYELVSKSDGTAYTLSTAPDDASDWAAKVEPGSSLPAAIYKNNDGVWKKSYWKDGKAQEPTEATSIEGGFFLMNRGSAAKDMTF